MTEILNTDQPNFVWIVLQNTFIAERAETKDNIHFLGHRKALLDDLIVEKLASEIPNWTETFREIETIIRSEVKIV